jgi:hypothetical protein
MPPQRERRRKKAAHLRVREMKYTAASACTHYMLLPVYVVSAAPVQSQKQELEQEGCDDSDAGRPPLEVGGDATQSVSGTSAGLRVGASARYARGAAGMSEYDEDDDESLQSDDEY